MLIILDFKIKYNMNILKTVINEGSLVFDVGCNIGSKAEEYLRFNTKVVGFEPQPKCVNALRMKFVGNTNMFIEEIGLDSKSGTSVIYEASYHSISSMSLDFINTVKKERFVDYSWGNEIPIKVDTLDNMILKYGKPGYIKIDVEGYELNVLKGLTTPIDVISIEFNPEMCSTSIECIDYLDALNGESSYNYGSQNNGEFKFDTWVSKDDIINFIKSINDFQIEFGDIYIKKA
jgi:FkbM family methyltransferase